MGSNARAALVAVVTATGGSPAGQRLCATLQDQALTSLMNAPAEVITAAGGDPSAPGRLKAVALLAEVCGACGLCPRGQALHPGERATPGKLGRHRRR